MKFNMLRKGINRIRKQDQYKRDDRKKIYGNHGDYVFLTNIPKDTSDEELDEAFDCFALKIVKSIEQKDIKRIEEVAKINKYFADVQMPLDDLTGFWTFKFRFDEFRLDDEYTIDTDAAEEDTLNDTANNTPTSNGNAVYSALVAGSNNDFI